MNTSTLWRLIGFYGVFYLCLTLVVAVGYPLAQTYAKPLLSHIFPLNPNTSLLKTLSLITLFYWGFAGVMIYKGLNQPDKPDV